VEALNNLGYLYDEGLGVRRDRTKARDFYTRAAEAGNAGAQMNLSAYYFGVLNKKTGEYEGLGGLPKDWTKALHWAQKAADQGEPGAAEKVTAITKLMQRGKK
ncbi:MAG TPA: tetratricopeptide repeat protein, partial [Verrucomicrobiota bacterium]|nr:tetratricopeptide repeat protein [Verrucomicrobiota bacterium]